MINHCQVYVVGRDSAFSPSATQNFAGIERGHQEHHQETSAQHKAREIHPLLQQGREASCRSEEAAGDPKTTVEPLHLDVASVLCYSRAEDDKKTGSELASATLQAQRCQLRWRKAGGCGSRTDARMGNLHAHSHSVSASLRYPDGPYNHH